MKERFGDRWVPVLLSALFHGSLVAALGWSWWQWHDRRPPPAPSLAIEATVVTAEPEAAPAPPAPEPEAATAPPQPDEAAAAEQRQAAEKRAAEQQELDRKAAEKLAADQQAAEQQAAEQKAAAEREAREQATRKEAEAAKQKAEKQKADKLKAQEALARQKLESDLRAQLAAEERLNAARAGGQQAQYAALIRARIERAWIRPPSARAGLNCEVHVTQVPGGEVTGVQIGSCNGDEAVRGSIEAAVYRASPLPTPENADLFERNLVFNFKPNE